jgi:hypothetical protein
LKRCIPDRHPTASARLRYAGSLAPHRITAPLTRLLQRLQPGAAEQHQYFGPVQSQRQDLRRYGFTLFNTPEALAARNANLTGTALYNQYRTGVGHYNLTDVSVMRVIEIGLKYRF